MATRVFLTFDYENNRYFKNQLVSWNKEHEFEFEFYDASLREAMDSSNGDYIKGKIKPLIQHCSHVLCIIGKNCARSKWFDWELQTAIAAGKKVAAVKVEDSCPTPKILTDDAVVWAPAFTFEAIKAAIEKSVVPHPHMHVAAQSQAGAEARR